MNLAPNAPRGDAEFEQHVHKAFTDCYFAKGFTGGGWAYAQNSNDTDGQGIDTDDFRTKLLEQRDRMAAWYIIGWDSIEVGAEESSAFFRVDVLAGKQGVWKNRAIRQRS